MAIRGMFAINSRGKNRERDAINTGFKNQGDVSAISGERVKEYKGKKRKNKVLRGVGIPMNLSV
jgi:hypothetical protein